MKTDKSQNYQTPKTEIVEMHTEQVVLNGSFTGEDINEWEIM